MNTPKRVVAIVACVLLGSVLAGAQESFKRAEDFLKKMQDTSGEIKGASEQLTKTMASLQAVSVAKGPVLRTAFGEFDKAVSSLESKTESVRKRATEMRAKGKDYFIAWQKEAAAIQNAELRKASEDRRVAMMTAHDGLTKTMTDGRGLLVTLMGDLQDLRNYLGTDLTESAVVSAQGLITTAQADAKKVEIAVAGVQKQLGAILARK
jgi:hypothetical protein